MGLCSFCNTVETEGFFKSYCAPCANLRRILILYDSTKCIEILNRVLLRTDTQINHKIKMELSPSTVSNDTKECPKPTPSAPIPVPSAKQNKK
jgi:hypothetical protein